MQPLTLPEQRKIEKLLSDLRSGELSFFIEYVNLDEYVDPALLIKALEMALQTNEALKEAWWRNERIPDKKYDKVVDNLKDFRK